MGDINDSGSISNSYATGDVSLLLLLLILLILLMLVGLWAI